MASIKFKSKWYVICEIVAMHDNLVPDVSMGTHFFNELVELDMLYFALYPGKDGNLITEEFFAKQPSRFLELLPGEEDWDRVIRVIDIAGIEDTALVLNADATKQRVVCYKDKKLG